MSDSVKPTAEDLARDLAGDLKICDAASEGPWVIERFCAADHDGEDAMTGVMCYAEEDGTGGVTVAEINRWSYGDDPPTKESEANARMIARSRAGWPAAIRRALAAEALLRRLVAAKDDFRAGRLSSDELDEAYDEVACDAEALLEGR